MKAISSAILAEEAVRLVRLLFLAGRDNRVCFSGSKLYFQVLYVLCNHPPPGLTMSRLAESMLVSPQQLSRLISGMEKENLVQREHDPANRRRVYVRALPAGQDELDAVIAKTRNLLAAELTMCSDEEMRRLHECFVFISHLLERSIMRYNQHLQEENPDEKIR